MTIQLLPATTITANPGGGQASATPITTNLVKIISASDGDSVALPVSKKGMALFTHNSGPASTEFFGNPLEPAVTINGNPGSAGFSRGVGNTGNTFFYCIVRGDWIAVVV